MNKGQAIFSLKNDFLFVNNKSIPKDAAVLLIEEVVLQVEQ